MAAEQPNEQEIQFKKRARRRLVGAIALVLLMVTVLPMLLDDRSAKTPQQEIAITIPSQENSDFTSKVVPITPETPPAAPASSAEEANAPAASAPAPETLPAAETPEKSHEAKAPEAKPAEKSAAKPAEKPAEKQPAQTAGNQPYAVQIGVFSTMASIKQLQQKLQAQGYQSYTEKLPTADGEKIRLRAGPFASRNEAEKAAAKIKDAGMASMVVAK